MRLFVDNLINLDFSYLHATRGLVGETWLASIELEGPLNEQGMICDFGQVKRVLREWLEQHLDHQLLVPTKAVNAKVSAHPHKVSVVWRCGDDKRIEQSAPPQAVTLIDQASINPDSVAAWCLAHLEGMFGEHVSHISLRFAPEKIEGPYYHYSHGLKKHQGQCQRIAHGHRSRIEIKRNGSISEDDMCQWASRWRDIYIASREDLRHETDETYTFKYRSQEGEFALTLPKSQCYIIDADTTVECIAQHVASTLKDHHPDDHFEVKAYEGLAKGAIACA